MKQTDAAPSQKTADGSIVNDASIVVNHFYRYLCSVISALQYESSHENVLPVMSSDFITYEDIFSLLLNLKTKSSAGPDNSPKIFLGRYAEPIAHILTNVFRLSSENSLNPDYWRTAHVVPVFRKGDCLKLQAHSFNVYIT